MLQYRQFGSSEFLVSSRVSFEKLLLCKICQYAKTRSKAVHGKLAKIDSSSGEIL